MLSSLRSGSLAIHSDLRSLFQQLDSNESIEEGRIRSASVVPEESFRESFGWESLLDLSFNKLYISFPCLFPKPCWTFTILLWVFKVFHSYIYLCIHTSMQMIVGWPIHTHAYEYQYLSFILVYFLSCHVWRIISVCLIAHRKERLAHLRKLLHQQLTSHGLSHAWMDTIMRLALKVSENVSSTVSTLCSSSSVLVKGFSMLRSEGSEM